MLTTSNPSRVAGNASAITLSPPESFGIVEQQVYRSNLPNPMNFSFLKQLSLKTVLLLSQEIPTRLVTQFFDDNGIQLVHLGLRQYKPAEAFWRPCPDDLVKDALELVLQKSAHPILVCDASGIHTVGVVVGCLRKLLNWNLNSIVNEYRSFAATKTRYVDEQFIELFDVDLLHVPNDQDAPTWFSMWRAMEEEDRNLFERSERDGFLEPNGVRRDESTSYTKYYFALAAAPLRSSD